MPEHNSFTLIHHAWAHCLADDINHARFSIMLSALSFLAPTPTARGPWPELWTAIKTAAKRRVTTEIFLPTPQLAHPATRQNATEAHKLHDLGVTVHLIPGPRLLHAKCAVIDAEITWIGSGNLTAAACGPNHELYARIVSPLQATSAAAFLAHLLHPA